MKYIRQFSIILTVSLIGELFKYILPFPIPASIYGLFLMFFCLTTGIVKLEHVKETAHLFIEIMQITFIPAGVALMTRWSQIKALFLPLMTILLVSNLTVMVATSRVSQLLIRKEKGKGDFENE